MKLITGGPRSGKTTGLIRMAAERFSYIVCRSHEEASRIAKQARKMGLDIPFPMSYAEFLQGRYYPPGVRGVLIDDLKALVEYQSEVPIFGATIELGIEGLSSVVDI